MRSGLSTILQTLTPEAASVLNHSIAEASRRNHGQTTPLHVAATLLASPSGFLRQACIRSHPNSSHPLQCRALELCFSVALERLPTAQNMPAGTEPPVSNALNAALKRAQANQRRGCPEQQQQPLLAVKVELEQLIISILDDPGVSRVMREASFSSPAVKATIEQTLNSTSSNYHSTPASFPLNPPPNRNMYLNPRLHQHGGAASSAIGNPKSEELRKIVEILLRPKKRNPILVGENEPETVVEQLFRKIEKGELGPLLNIQVIPIGKDLLSDRDEIPIKIKELGALIASRITTNGGVILDLGDLKWLVEQQPVISDASRSVVAEIGKLLAGNGRIWLIGTATCETYLRCQVYHSTMENDWDLQAVPMASKSTNPGIGISPCFSSPAVKATIEQTLNSTSSNYHSTPASFPLNPPPNRNMYLNPRLHQHGGAASSAIGNPKSEELRKIVEILLRPKKRNPILVGENEPETVVEQLFRKIEKGELGPLLNIQVIPIGKDLLSDRDEIPIKIKELGALIASRITTNGGVILDLGDLKWLVEQQPVISDASRSVVAEIGKLLAGNGRIWLIGTATCETYLRCQVYHSTMENDWDLQAVPMASKSTNPGIGISPWLGKERLLNSNPCEGLSQLKNFHVASAPPLLRCIPENLNLVRRTASSLCPQCMEKYEQEVAKLVSEFDNSPSSDTNSDSAKTTLPQWLQNAKLSNNGDKGASLSQSKDQEILKLKTQALQKKWSEKCLQLHPNFHHNVGSEKTVSPMLGMPGLQNPNLLLRQPLQPKLQIAKNLGETLQPKLQNPKGLGESLQLNTHQKAGRPPEIATSPPKSPVRTELALGQKPNEITSQKSRDEHVKDFLGCISSEPEKKILDKFANALDADTYKRLLKGLMEKAWWQQDAASAVASAVTRCRLGNGRQRGGASKGDIWLLFTGPDRIGKRKMASVLADQICGASPILISLGSRRDDEETDKDFRGKTAIDRIAEAVRRNPFSVIMLEDVDEANMLVRGNIKRAMERGRLTDSHGREISLGNIIFILTGNWSTVNPESHRTETLMDDKNMSSLCSGNSQLRLAIGEKSTKRRASWELYDEDRRTKVRNELGSRLGFDLNEAADGADDRTDGSHNSSDLTIEHEEEHGLVENMEFSITSVPHELVNFADDSVVFRPVDFAFICREIKKTITKKFSMVVEEKIVIEVEEDVVERILAGLWRGQKSLEEWVKTVLAPSFEKLRAHENTIVRLQLEPDTDLSSRSNGDWLPSKVTVTAS